MKKSIQCNVCGKEVKKENGFLKEDFLMINKEWGYFSNKDIEIHSFKICEECYDKWIATFAIPVVKKKVSEIM
ncbi:MAG: hypothetical protein ACERKN_08435 [Velocimicrobium sp.]